MIGIYDGWPAGVGRVVVDSCTDHWLDTHTAAIKRLNGDDWSKIRQYYINVATWLTPPDADFGPVFRPEWAAALG